MTSADESAVKIEEERIGFLSEGGWASWRLARAPSRVGFVSTFRNPCPVRIATGQFGRGALRAPHGVLMPEAEHGAPRPHSHPGRRGERPRRPGRDPAPGG